MAVEIMVITEKITNGIAQESGCSHAVQDTRIVMIQEATREGTSL